MGQIYPAVSGSQDLTRDLAPVSSLPPGEICQEFLLWDLSTLFRLICPPSPPHIPALALPLFSVYRSAGHAVKHMQIPLCIICMAQRRIAQEFMDEYYSIRFALTETKILCLHTP
jgi:hypothetical protein